MDKHIIPFPQAEVEDMSLSQVEAYLENLRKEIADLDRREPRDEESEEYEAWADEHEELEDLLDEALDRMEALRD